MSVTCEEIIAAVSSLRLSPVIEEYALHDAIADVLAAHGIPCTHEAKIGPRSRIDFLCDHIGIEVKRGKPARAALLSQLARYCESEQIDALILVVERTANLPRACRGKPVYVLSLNRLWGVSLP